MFIEKLLNQGNAPLIAKMVEFTEKRHELIAENVANISTPNYVQKDLDLREFQTQLRDRIEERKRIGSTSFDDVSYEIDQPVMGVLFHDKSNRSVETLMSNMSSNALRHNFFVELLRKQYDSIQNVLRERIA